MELSEEARQARNAYYRQWHAKHPGKQYEYCKRYWEKKISQCNKINALDFNIENEICEMNREGYSVRNY